MDYRDDDITAWLQNLTSGRGDAMDELLPRVYDELRMLARKRLRSERDAHTLSTTGLVNETYRIVAAVFEPCCCSA